MTIWNLDLWSGLNLISKNDVGLQVVYTASEYIYFLRTFIHLIEKWAITEEEVFMVYLKWRYKSSS